MKLKPVIYKVEVNLKEAIINELKNYQEQHKNKNESFKTKFDYIMLDFKRRMKIKLLIENLEEPHYNGKCYNFKWLKSCNKNIVDIYSSEYVKKGQDI